MGTLIRATVSEKNPYWIDKHRYYELKHFCMQYHAWQKTYELLEGLNKYPNDLIILSKRYGIGDPTGKCVERRSYYFERIKMVEQTAMETNQELGKYILKGVTDGISYDYLKARLDIPCCKDIYYNLYRKFFWLLDKRRQ